MVSERVQRQIERLLDEAEEAIARYDWEAVRQAAQAVIRLDPENSDALAYLAAAERDLPESAVAQRPAEITTKEPQLTSVASPEPTEW